MSVVNWCTLKDGARLKGVLIALTTSDAACRDLRYVIVLITLIMQRLRIILQPLGHPGLPSGPFWSAAIPFDPKDRF